MTTPRSTVRSLLFGLASVALGAVLGVACGGPVGGSCKFNPFCGTGEFGAYCDNDGQCRDSYCCGNDHCAGGMCSLPCGKGLPNCPASMTCHAGSCMFACRFNADCADGQRCRSDRYCSWDD